MMSLWKIRNIFECDRAYEGKYCDKQGCVDNNLTLEVRSADIALWTAIQVHKEKETKRKKNDYACNL